MTFCFSFTGPKLAVVAADTRVLLRSGGDRQAYSDGPNDLTLSVETPRYDQFVPFRMRKLRCVGGTWIATAGDYIVGAAAIELLQTRGYRSFAEVKQMLDASDILLKTKCKTGFSEELLRQTLLLLAPFSSSGAWAYSFEGNSVDPSGKPATYLVNWPTSIPDATKCAAEAIFKIEMKAAMEGASLEGLIKAAARITQAACSSSCEVGPYVQIGVTVPGWAGTDSFYMSGLSSELLEMSRLELSHRLEKIA